MATLPKIEMPLNNTPYELSKFKVLLHQWNISASRLPPRNGYLPFGNPATRSQAAMYQYGIVRRKQLTAEQASALLLAAPYMEPMDLLHLTRMCRRMRKVLMTKENRHVWTAALRKYPSFPACPRHLIQPHYVSLIYGRECNACGTVCSQIEVRFWTKIGWLLCSVCLRENLINEDELLVLYDIVAIVDRPENSPLPQRIPREDLRLFLPYHPLSFTSPEGMLVPVNHYYRPEAEAVVRQYMGELVRNSGTRRAREIMVELRVHHVRRVNQFADDFADSIVADTAASWLAVPTLREEIMDRANIEARGYELEDLQRRARKHDGFLDQPVVDDDVWTNAQPHIWNVLSDKRTARLAQKVEDSVDYVLLYVEDFVSTLPLDDSERMLLPNQSHTKDLDCLVKLMHECDPPPTYEQFAAFLPALEDALHEYMAALPGRFLVPLDAYFAEQDITQQYSRPRNESAAERTARRLGMAAALFTFGAWTRELRPLVMRFPHIHGHWRENFPQLAWDVPYRDGDFAEEREPWVLHGMAVYKPGLLHIRALEFPDDIPMAVMDQLVRAGRLQCACQLSRLEHSRGAEWGWAELVSHCASEDWEWHKIWGHPDMAMTGKFPLWPNGHAVGDLRLFDGVREPVPEYAPHSPQTLQNVQRILQDNDGRELLGCRICRDAVCGAGRDPARAKVFRELPALSTSRDAVDIAHHFRTKHKMTNIPDWDILFE